jgi:hypothetical protein
MDVALLALAYVLLLVLVPVKVVLVVLVVVKVVVDVLVLVKVAVKVVQEDVLEAVAVSAVADVMVPVLALDVNLAVGALVHNISTRRNYTYV